MGYHDDKLHPAKGAGDFQVWEKFQAEVFLALEKERERAEVYLRQLRRKLSEKTKRSWVVWQRETQPLGNSQRHINLWPRCLYRVPSTPKISTGGLLAKREAWQGWAGIQPDSLKSPGHLKHHSGLRLDTEPWELQSSHLISQMRKLRP